MVFLITGNGKGKTTSAMGMVVRALGHGFKCAVIQFIKSRAENTGEFRLLHKNNVFWKTFGDGFTWEKDSLENTSEKCKSGWELFKSIANDFDLIVLDEFTYVFNMKMIEQHEVIDFLKSVKNHIVITGRDADKRLIEISDTVSEIVEIRHHYKKYKTSIKGIEF